MVVTQLLRGVRTVDFRLGLTARTVYSHRWAGGTRSEVQGAPPLAAHARKRPSCRRTPPAMTPVILSSPHGMASEV